MIDYQLFSFDQVQPLFKKFNVDSEVVITERANHARDYLQDCSLEGIGK